MIYKMKKLFTLICASLCASQAFSANVTLYGTIDAGLGLTHHDNGQTSLTSLKQTSGSLSATIFGMKGVEKISPTLSAGFDLESGFAGDDGQLGFNGRLFGRKSFVYLNNTDLGQVSMGRVPAITVRWHKIFSPYDATSGSSLSNFRVLMSTVTARPDNVIDYKSPEFGGFSMQAQYSTDTNSLDPKVDHTQEGSNDVERYAGIGARWHNANLDLTAILDYVDYRSTLTVNTEDGYALTLGGNYKFDNSARVYLMLHGFTHGKQNVGFIGTNTTYQYGKGMSVLVGGEKAFGNSLVKFSVGHQYAKADQANAEDDDKVQRTMSLITYQYNFSKRTSWYATAGYARDSFKASNAKDGTAYGVESGLIHSF